MIKFIFLIFLCVISLFVSNATAEIYKCITGGQTTYQSEPCENTSQLKNRSGAFDGWKFGETITTVKRITRSRQIPMSPGSSTFFSSYNEKIINSKPAERKYTYKTKIFDKLTTVTLFFTELSQQLYKIESTFHVFELKPEERKYFYESLFSQLSEKYGKPTNISKSQNIKTKGIISSISSLLSRNMTKNLIGSNLVWQMNNDSQVTLLYKKNYHLMSSYKLTYINSIFSIKNTKEVRKEIKDRTDRLISQDINRL